MAYEVAAAVAELLTTIIVWLFAPYVVLLLFIGLATKLRRW